MSGGQWTDPVDVGVEAVPTTLLTNIADDLRCLHKGNGQTALTTISVDVSNVLDIGGTDQSFKVSGTNTLKYITTTGRQEGNVIFLIKTGDGNQIYFGAGSVPGGTLSVKTGQDGITQNWLVGRMICLVLDDTGWHYDLPPT